METGTSAIMTSMWARGELGVGDEFVHEGILGEVFVGKVLEETTLGRDDEEIPLSAATATDLTTPGFTEIPAIVNSITGSAWVTGHSHLVVDPTDPFPTGYTVGDIWA